MRRERRSSERIFTLENARIARFLLEETGGGMFLINIHRGSRSKNIEHMVNDEKREKNIQTKKTSPERIILEKDGGERAVYGYSSLG